MSTATAIPANWIAWIEENRALGVDAAAIVRVLVENGFEAGTAREQVQRPRTSHPRSPTRVADEAADGTSETEKLQQRLSKLEAMMAAYSELWSGDSAVERKSNVPAHEFFRSSYAVNRPVVLTGIFAECAALRLWSPEYLAARCGAEMVEVMTGRSADRDYEINANRHKSRIRLAEFVNKVNAARESNDFYMVANNRALESPAMQSLMGEVRVFDSILDPQSAAGRMFLWFGPGGTVTPLHHDTSNILLAQVYGRKMITLVPSFQTPLVYNHIGVFSAVNPERPDYGRYPLFRKATQLKVLLEPGQALFIPVGWWHHVRSLDISISLSFTNFRAPNSFAWD